MDKEEATLPDFIADKDGEYSRAQVLALARRLQKEGRRTTRIRWALIGVAFTLLREDDLLTRDYFYHGVTRYIEAEKKADQEFIDYLKEQRERYN